MALRSTTRWVTDAAVQWDGVPRPQDAPRSSSSKPCDWLVPPASEAGREAHVGKHRHQGEQGAEREQAVAGPVDGGPAKGGGLHRPRGGDQRGRTGRGGGGRGARGGTAAGAADGDGADHARGKVQGAEVRVGARLGEPNRAGGAVPAQLVDAAA